MRSNLPPTKTPRSAVPSVAQAKPVARASAKPVAKKVAVPVRKPAVAAKPAPLAKPAAASKPTKHKKVKMVRDKISIPETEYLVLAGLKLRAAKLGHPVKKTLLIRAGIKALAAMADAAFVPAIRAIPKLKDGRPTQTS